MTRSVVLLENPQLSYPPVMKALRLLGSKFFQEVQTGKATQKTKVYDTMVTEEASDGSCMVSQSMPADDDEVSPEFLEALVSQDDPDAIAVQAFETEFEDFVQDTPEYAGGPDLLPGSPPTPSRQATWPWFLACPWNWQIQGQVQVPTRVPSRANIKVDRTCWPRSRSPDAEIAINLAIGKPSAL